MIPSLLGVLARPEFDPLVLRVNTNITYTGSTANNQFQLRYIGIGYAATVDWGDGNTTNISGNFGTATTTTHTYASSGIYLVSIYGLFPHLVYQVTSDRNKILEVVSWGDISWSSMTNSFNGCQNLDVTATNAPTISSATSLNNTFRATSLLTNSVGSISTWNTSNISSFANVFRDSPLFNQNLGSWNVSNVTNFTEMFNSASAFNNGGSSDINNWSINTTGSVNMQGMFRLSAFNQNISSWNTQAVTSMNSMFANTPFNQDISSWNVSNVSDMSGIFNSSSFNQNLGAWQLRTAGVNLTNIFRFTSMSTANYTNTIVAWANYVFNNSGTPSGVLMSGQAGRTFDTSLSGGANFANAGAARTYLTGTVGWTINGDTVI